MSKSSHFTGQPVYSQVLKLLDKAEIRRISRSTGSSERYVKRLDGSTWSSCCLVYSNILIHCVNWRLA